MSRFYYPPLEPADLLVLARTLRAVAGGERRDSRTVVLRGFTTLLADRLEQLALEWDDDHVGVVGAFEAAADIANEVRRDLAYDPVTSAEIARRIAIASAAWRRYSREEP